MTDTIGAPTTGADVSGASSSATTTPASAGRPSRSSLTRSLKEKIAEKSKTGPASSVEDAQTDGAPRADGAAKTEGDTATPDAGKGEKQPVEKQVEPETVPMAAFKERLAKEKGRREKLEADLHASKGREAKLQHLFEVSAAENERLTEALAQGQKFDERGEELHSLKLQNEVKARFAAMEEEHRQALAATRRDAEAGEIVKAWLSDIAAAAAEFPLVSRADMREAIKNDPNVDVREWARVEHERRTAAFEAKRSERRADTSNLPTTVAKPTGVSKFQPPLSAKGMAQALRHARAKG